MGLDLSALSLSGLVFGISSQEEYSETADLSFLHGTQVVTYRLRIDTAPPLDHNRWLPSLLGMDVIRRWRMVCDVHDDELSFDVHHADDVRELGTTS